MRSATGSRPRIPMMPHMLSNAPRPKSPDLYTRHRLNGANGGAKSRFIAVRNRPLQDFEISRFHLRGGVLEPDAALPPEVLEVLPAAFGVSRAMALPCLTTCRPRPIASACAGTSSVITEP